MTNRIKMTDLPIETQQICALAFAMGFCDVQGDNALVLAIANQSNWPEMQASAKAVVLARDEAKVTEFCNQVREHVAHFLTKEADDYTALLAESSFVGGAKKIAEIQADKELFDKLKIENNLDTVADVVDKKDKSDG